MVYLAEIRSGGQRFKAVGRFEALHPSAFLVGGNNERIGGKRLKVGGEARQLLARSDVARTDFGTTCEVDVEEHDAPHLQIANVARGIAIGIHTVAFKAHHQHLRGIEAQLFVGRNLALRHRGTEQKSG